MRCNAESVQMMTCLAASMLQLSTGIGFVALVITQWRLYQTDDDIKTDWAITVDGNVVPLDVYWARVFKQIDGLGNVKYAILKTVVKAALCVSHGQADVERGFSLNKHIVIESRTLMKQRTIVALRTYCKGCSQQIQLRGYNANFAKYDSPVPFSISCGKGEKPLI